MPLPLNVAFERGQPAYRRIAGALRSQILAQALSPGARLPSTGDLAATYQTSYFTIHTALMALVKEGLLERRHGSGTYVAQPKKEIECVGIYYTKNVWAYDETFFCRNVHHSLVERLGHLKRAARIFVDSRPESAHGEVFPVLTEAIDSGEIQALVSPHLTNTEMAALKKLPVPSAFVTYSLPTAPDSVSFDRQGFLRESLRRLAAQGCQSVGWLTWDAEPSSYETFLRELGFTRMFTRECWASHLPTDIYKLAEFGYHEFRKLWALPEKPDGLIIYPDSVARGVITSILEYGIRVPEQLKLVVHRNAHANLFCPFPVTWAISDEEAVADGLIQLIESQFRGESTSPIVLPYTFEEATMGPDGAIT